MHVWRTVHLRTECNLQLNIQATTTESILLSESRILFSLPKPELFLTGDFPTCHVFIFHKGSGKAHCKNLCNEPKQSTPASGRHKKEVWARKEVGILSQPAPS